MKIGLVTIFDVPNYGAMLQCYSLYRYLKTLGHEVVLIKIPFPQPNYGVKEAIKKRILWRFSHKFVSKYLPYTEDMAVEVDAYMVGSDQVWNPKIVGEWALPHFMLDFTPDDKPRYSYASSFGVTLWPAPYLKEQATTLLKRFDKITVREESAVKLLKDEFGIESQMVLDPCFLDDNFDELGFVGRVPEISTLVTFKLEPFKSDNWLLQEEKLARSLNCSLVKNSWGLYFPFLKRTIRGLNLYCVPIEKWIKNISQARYVVSDSFHGIVFAIKYQKQFAVIDSGTGRFTRIESLLKMLGLESRVAKGFDDVNRVLSTSIDYSLINPKLVELQEKSRNILRGLLMMSN